MERTLLNRYIYCYMKAKVESCIRSIIIIEMSRASESDIRTL